MLPRRSPETHRDSHRDGRRAPLQWRGPGRRPPDFLNETAHADLERFLDEARVFDTREQDDGTLGFEPRDFARGFDATHDRHGDVQHRNIGGVALDRVNRGAAVRLVRYDLKATALQ